MNSPRSFCFGPFVLVPERQLLLRGDTTVRIGGRALDLLTALVERPGEVVTKAELMARVWPSTFVEEANLKVNMSALRQVLGERVDEPNYIATVPGRGYRFVAPVQTSPSPSPVEISAEAAAPNRPATTVEDVRLVDFETLREYLRDRPIVILFPLSLQSLQRIRHAHQRGERARGHLSHDTAAVYLNGDFGDVQSLSDLLVEQTTGD